MVEDIFRSAKSLLATRPIFHKYDETIRGHIFCSFLALVMRKELEDRLAVDGHRLEWADIVHDLERLSETEVEQDAKRYILRNSFAEQGFPAGESMITERPDWMA